MAFNPRDYLPLEEAIRQSSMGAPTATLDNDFSFDIPDAGNFGYNPFQPSEADMNAWNDWSSQPAGAQAGGAGMAQTSPNGVQQQVPSAAFDYEMYEYFSDPNTFRPTDEFGNDLPFDQLQDWYLNNPDAQFYKQQWKSGQTQPPPAEPPPSQPPPSQPPPAEPPPMQPGTDWSTGGAPGGEGWPDFTTAEPLQMAEQDRMNAQAWADLLDQGSRDSQNQYQNLESNARDQAWSGPGGYGDILAGQGGFNESEQNQILQEEMLRNGMASQAELDSLYLDPGEMERITGNPNAARDLAAGKLTYLDQWLREGDAAQRGAVSALDTDLNAAVDPAKLGLSEEYLRDYAFGDADVDALAEQASRNIQTSAAARNQSLADAAFAQGNTSPLALAAAQGRGRVAGDIAAQDAITDARLKGKNMQLDVAAGREDARLNTERDISGRLRDIGSEIRQTQLGTEKNLSDAWNDYGRYNTDLMYGATKAADDTTSERAGQVASNRQNIGGQNLNTRFGQAGQASTALSSRYGQIAGQKKAEEAEGRGFLVGQQDRAQAGAQSTMGQRTGLYGTRIGGLNTSTAQVINAKNLPTALDKGLGFVGGLLGG